MLEPRDRDRAAVCDFFWQMDMHDCHTLQRGDAAAAAGGARGGGPLMQPCNRAHQIVSQIAHPGSSRSAPLLLLPFIFIPSLPRAALIPTRAALSLALPAGLPLALHSSHIVVSLSLSAPSSPSAILFLLHSPPSSIPKASRLHHRPASPLAAHGTLHSIRPIVPQ